MEKQNENAVRITWLGHSCFRIESGGYSVVLDPYQDGSVPGLPPLRVNANEVLCSHGHRDHCAAELVSLLPAGKSPFTVTRIETWHDDAQGAKRGPNTIHVLDNGSVKIAHLGDLGCELTAEQKRQLTGLDAVLIPVGGFFTIDAVQAKALTDELCPKVVIPMHYRSDADGFGYDVIGPLEAYTDLCELVVQYPGSTLELTPDTDAHVAVLRLSRGQEAGL